MSDGLFLPGAPDGMAAFAGSRPELAIVIRNHELLPGSSKGPWGKKFERLGKVDAAKLYDRGEGKRPAPAEPQRLCSTPKRSRSSGNS